MWWNIIYNIEYKHWYTVVICGVDRTKKVWKKWQKKYLGQPYRCCCYTSRWPGTHTAQYIRNLAKGHKNWNKLMRLSKKYMSKYCRPTFSWIWPFWSTPDTHIYYCYYFITLQRVYFTYNIIHGWFFSYICTKIPPLTQSFFKLGV